MKESLQKHSHVKKGAFSYNTQRICHKWEHVHNFCLLTAVITICLKRTSSLCQSCLDISFVTFQAEKFCTD